MSIERVFMDTERTFPWYMLFDGTAHMTEPYFLLDSTYSGSGKSCLSNSDCPPSDEANKNETCSASKVCEQPIRPRILMLRSTCTTVGTESMFYTRKAPEKPAPSASVSTGAAVYIVVVTVVLVCVLLLLGFVVFRERYGNPLFRSRY